MWKKAADLLLFSIADSSGRKGESSIREKVRDIKRLCKYLFL
jgi:hypothetical protein